LRNEPKNKEKTEIPTYWLHAVQIFLIINSYSTGNEFRPCFMQRENLWPVSYEPTSGPYSEPHEFGSHLPTLFIYAR
jgi:hypothetical protein